MSFIYLYMAIMATYSWLTTSAMSLSESQTYAESE